MSISFSFVFPIKIKPSHSLVKGFIVSYCHVKFRGYITGFIVFTELSLIYCIRAFVRSALHASNCFIFREMRPLNVILQKDL